VRSVTYIPTDAVHMGVLSQTITKRRIQAFEVLHHPDFTVVYDRLPTTAGMPRLRACGASTMTDRGDEISRDNRRIWDRWSDSYQRKHGGLLDGANAEAWGLWRRPEHELGVLDPIDGQSVLELGCGAAGWAASMAGRGARVVGLDISGGQLGHAKDVEGLGLVLADAQSLPFADRSFDLVFSDYGGMSWADPYRTVPEVARVLRTGGQLAFCTNTPFFAMCWDSDDRTLTATLRRAYFGLHIRNVAPGANDYVLGYGGWIRLFRSCGLVVETLIEEPPPAGAVTTFTDRPAEWTSQWPIEAIWSARKL
jgi:SAM-dependent methyltransferase